jgi:cold shock CspA family protein
MTFYFKTPARSVVAVLAGCVVLAGCGGTTDSAKPATTAAAGKSAAVSSERADKEVRSTLSAQDGRVGTVKFWNAAKGFGIILDDGTEIFVKVTGLRPPVTNLEPGQLVRYLVRSGRKSPDAVDVSIVGWFPAKAGGRGG